MKAQDIKNLSLQWAPVSGILSPIKTKKGYENAISLLDQLIATVGDDEKHPLASLMYHLGNLIDAYETKDKEIKKLGTKSDAISMIKFLMDQHGLKQADLKDVFGSQGNVSEVLRGIRDLNLKQIKKLAEKFHVNPSVFIETNE
jgi:HTH-type transcriptional regulator / antitoxin HigA